MARRGMNGSGGERESVSRRVATLAFQGHRPTFDAFHAPRPPSDDRLSMLGIPMSIGERPSCSIEGISARPICPQRQGVHEPLSRIPSRIWKSGGFRLYWENSGVGVMPGRPIAELNRGDDRPGLREMRRLAVSRESAIRRIAMRRMASRTRTIRTNRARPVLESLEGRQLLSGGLVHQTRESAVASATGVFSQRDRAVQLHHALGRPCPDQDRRRRQPDGDDGLQLGALQLEYGGTNAYSKIVGQVSGGGNRAPLASIMNSQLVKPARGTA